MRPRSPRLSSSAIPSSIRPASTTPCSPSRPTSCHPWLRALPDRRAVTLRPHACYLLASDGFWSCLDPAEFVARWPRLFAGAGAAACVEALFAEIALRPPVGLQPDNLTAIVLRTRGPHRDETALPSA
ncbi:hypothetical protein [Massilia sp. Dwa41.01b]|uniref:hypothetical protein n=1 Tax=Massilia sp. Dwa41.01b TaxID=2709302 RepID=UPI001E5E432C|nr:hypothetical protein [Massilia sp. Dwa41.01b]